MKELRKIWREHSLSIVSVVFLSVWLGGYLFADPESHWGAFCSNAVADWAGSLVLILGTKFLFESGSAESNPVRTRSHNRVLRCLKRHSLLLFLFLTGLIWLVLFLRTHPQSKWGELVASLVSEWVQMAGLVFLTKRLTERNSKESH